jgi:hypothetical protein
VPPSVATGAVRSYRTLSPLPSSRLPATLRRFAFCCTFRGLAPPRRYLAPHPPEPGLSSPPIKAYASMEAAIAQPTSQGIVGFFIGKKSANAAFFGHYSGRRRQKAWFLPPAGTRSYARAADRYRPLVLLGYRPCYAVPPSLERRRASAYASFRRAPVSCAASAAARLGGSSLMRSETTFSSCSDSALFSA